ncbi:MAG: hypothetical protein GWM93_06335, partial [Gemmatimonadetes bacterium]|nr:hypothetical protein [Gemmatimonadota bacterium]NIT66293.1 hypothetical protein [Gemmatimonadota bacterium]NIY34870.1 hypothetical protein [Gemmatimonadota bacterium]
PRPELTWPAPPMPERIAWRGEVETGPAGSVDEGFWKRLIGAIFGRRETEIVRPAAVHGDPGGVLYVVDAGAGAVHLI